MAIPTASAAALNAVAPGSLGKASAIFSTLRQFGAVFGIAIGTAIFNSNGSLASPAAVTSGYRPAMAAAAGFSVLGAVAAVAIRKRAAAVGPEPGVTVPGQAEPAENQPTGNQPPDFAPALRAK
jgi:hypothetical protein